MIVSMIVAMTKDRVIGKNGNLPWHIPADLKYFKAVTMGKPIIMGRKTYESLPRKPLPGRTNIVITTNTNFVADGAKVVFTPDEALNLCSGADEVVIIGGATIYAHFMPIASRLYLTEVKGDYTGDTYFPKLKDNSWQLCREDDNLDFVSKVFDKISV